MNRYNSDMARADRIEAALRALTDWARFDPTYDPNRDALVFEAQEALAMPADPPATPSEDACPECEGEGYWRALFAKEKCRKCGGSGRATPQGCQHTRTATRSAGDPFIECLDCKSYKMLRDNVWRST